MIITPVPKEHVAKAWLLSEPFIAKAVKLVADRYTTLDLWEAMCRDEYQLWVMFDNDHLVGAFLTQIMDHPQARGINIPFLGAEEHRVNEWIDQILEAVEDYGRLNNCTLMEFFGREGWNKFLKPAGFKKAMCIFEKEI